MAREQLDPYDVLGVARHASESDVARAYRRAARATHPDAGSADAERFHEVNHAYETLRNPRRRAAYDRAQAHRPAVPSPGQHIVLGAPQAAPATFARLLFDLLRRA